MANDLMELVKTGIVENFEYTQFDVESKKVERFKNLGMETVANSLSRGIQRKISLAKISRLKLIKITEEQINKYLEQKVVEYNNSMGKSKTKAKSYFLNVVPLRENWVTRAIFDNATQEMFTMPSVFAAIKKTRITKHTVHAALSEEGTIGQFVWTETPLDEYTGIPPEFVLKKIEEHRVSFDTLVIAEVNSVKDPLLLGRINGCSDRYFIAQWGEDVKLDDII